MQVSLETLSGLERRMTIEVPADQVEVQIQNRLQEASKTVDMKGFRKGKVPMKVIKNRFGKGVRQEVVGELMSQSYYEAVNQENVKPAGQPKIETKSIEEGQNLEFTATFEVYPELDLSDFSAIKVTKKVTEIKPADIDKMVTTLREQKQTYSEVKRASKQNDKLNIDFDGTVDGEPFEGGSAESNNLILGSNSMIPGFEDGLVGVKKGDEKVLELAFPDSYHNKELAGKATKFTIKVNSVSKSVLPKLDDEFFASFDVTEGGEEAFRTEVSGNMARELKTASRNHIKTQIIDGLAQTNKVEVPKALLENEINVLRQQAMQQFGGGGNIDASMLPAELFSEQAEKRVSLGLIMGEIIQQKNLKSDPKAVRSLIEEMAESYEHPEEVINWYYGNEEQLANIESMALEEAVIDLVLDAVKVEEIKCSYEDALKPDEPEKVENVKDAKEADTKKVKKAPSASKKKAVKKPKNEVEKDDGIKKEGNTE